MYIPTTTTTTAYVPNWCTPYWVKCHCHCHCYCNCQPTVQKIIIHQSTIVTKPTNVFDKLGFKRDN